MKILLIAGHGDGDPGACAQGYQEATLTRELVNMINVRLSKYTAVDVFPTERNLYTWLQKNTTSFKGYDYVLEVHFNATPGGYGVEALVHPSENGTTVESEMLKGIQAIGFRNRGVKVRSNLLTLNVIKGRQRVSHCILETCFIDSESDMKLYIKNKNSVADAIVLGILKGFGLEEIKTDIKADKEGEESEMIYNYIDKNMPEWARPTIQKLVDKGILKGNDRGELGLNDTMLRIFVAHDQAGLYDLK